MFSWKKYRSRPKTGIKKDSSFSPSRLPIRDLLSLYDFSENMIIAGALCDSFLSGTVAEQRYLAWKKALRSNYGSLVCDLVISALETNFSSMDESGFNKLVATQDDVVILRMAILVHNISRLCSLSNEEVDKWIDEVRSVLKFKKAHKEMSTYLGDALSYVSKNTF